MPYANIVFAKLEKRLLNDPRWFMLSEPAQLNYVRLILTACETYNRIPKDIPTIKMMFRTPQDEKTILGTIQEISKAYPKFKTNCDHYYFEDFDEKTNFIPKEIRRKSQGTPEELQRLMQKKNKNKKKNKIFPPQSPKGDVEFHSRKQKLLKQSENLLKLQKLAKETNANLPKV